MIRIFWLLLLALIIALSISWVVDNNGLVSIQWLGYEIKTDILTSILLIIMAAMSIFIFAYFLGRLFSINLLQIFRIFSKKREISSLKRAIKEQDIALDLLFDIFVKLESDEGKECKKLFKKFGKLVEKPQLNDYIANQIELKTTKPKAKTKLDHIAEEMMEES